MATRITVKKDCNLGFLKGSEGGGYRKKGYVIDLPDNYPSCLSQFKKKSSFYACLRSECISIEYIVEPKFTYSPLKSSPVTPAEEVENNFKRAEKDEVFTDGNIVTGDDQSVDIPVKETPNTVDESVEETVEEGDKEGGTAKRANDHDAYLSEISKPGDTAVTEHDVKSQIGKVEETEEEGDSEYMNGASVPSEKTEETYEETEGTTEEEKPYKETDVELPPGKDDEYADDLEVQTAHVSQPEYAESEVIDFLVTKGVNKRVAKSAARIIVEPISDTKKQLSLYGINTGNINEILGYLDEFRISKDPS